MIHSLFPLLLSLLLWGCAAQNPPAQTTPATMPELATDATVSSFISVQSHSEDGGLEQYSLSAPVCGMLSLGKHLLLFSGDGTALTLINPDTWEVLAVHEAGLVLTPENFTVQILQNGISYFDGPNLETVVLDDSLREIRRIAAPENLRGAPLLSSDCRSLYYCTPDAIRALDLDTGISRILKEASYPVQGLSGLLFGSAVVQVSITDTDGSWRTLFLSAETGQLLQEREGNILPETTAHRFFIRSEDGGLLFGETGDVPMTLNPRLPESDCFFLPETFCAVTAGLAENSTVLELYDLKTGGRLAQLTLDSLLSPKNVWQSADGAIWFLTAENPHLLYRWDAAASPVSDFRQYSSPCHTRENPDYDGLAACTLYAREIGEKYGVEILIYKDAVAAEPWDYRLDYEFQVPVLRRELESLDAHLGRFPEGLLKTLGRTFTSLRICIVGEISPASGGPEIVSGIQFLDGYDACIVLSARENTEKALYHELCHLMETVVLTRSTAYDRWESLNPEGFQYGDFPEDNPYLQEGRAYFMDAYAMTQPKEDRARLFEYAMTAGHEALFRSPNLQAKLKKLCTGLREGFSLEDDPGMLPWEQYLIKE